MMLAEVLISFEINDNLDFVFWLNQTKMQEKQFLLKLCLEKMLREMKTLRIKRLPLKDEELNWI